MVRVRCVLPDVQSETQEREKQEIRAVEMKKSQCQHVKTAYFRHCYKIGGLMAVRVVEHCLMCGKNASKPERSGRWWISSDEVKAKGIVVETLPVWISPEPAPVAGLFSER